MLAFHYSFLHCLILRNLQFVSFCLSQYLHFSTNILNISILYFPRKISFTYHQFYFLIISEWSTFCHIFAFPGKNLSPFEKDFPIRHIYWLFLSNNLQEIRFWYVWLLQEMFCQLLPPEKASSNFSSKSFITLSQKI